MIRPIIRHALFGAILVGAALGCSSGGDGGGGSGTADAGTTTGAACAADNRKDIYAAGMAKQTGTGALSIKLMDAMPAPPQKQSNTMVLQVLDSAGAPVDGATVSVTPFMPDHGHGSSVKPTVTAKGGGLYDVANVYLPMPGLWRLTVTVQMPSVAAQDAAFQFCIDG
ncbi:MAG: hypothetical protein JWO86_1824 [Myxococcaceae bacterium]|nr:hypothetical protein [Myxococcaceae bacterium]